jgi:hypothetical protein
MQKSSETVFYEENSLLLQFFLRFQYVHWRSRQQMKHTKIHAHTKKPAPQSEQTDKDSDLLSNELCFVLL